MGKLEEAFKAIDSTVRDPATYRLPNSVVMEAYDDEIPWHPGNFYVTMMEPRLRKRYAFMKNTHGITNAIVLTKFYDGRDEPVKSLVRYKV